MQGISTNGVYACDDITPLSFKKCKPILRPLSSFEKKSCLELMKTFNCSMEIIHEVWKLIQEEIKLEDITLKTYKMMCENHVDFNKLIEEELAVDVNTIEN